MSTDPQPNIVPCVRGQEHANPHPERCPWCGSIRITICPEWFAHSLDDCDLHNTAVLTEFQCRNEGASCYARSFWY